MGLRRPGRRLPGQPAVGAAAEDLLRQRRGAVRFEVGRATPKYVVAAADEIPPGGRKIVEVGGRSIGIFNLGGEYFALRNRCPHQGGPLCEGRVWGALESSRPGEFRYSGGGEILTCIWHGWEFDIRTGQSWCDPARLRVKRYDVQTEPGERVKGPYVAETYPVTTEGEYLVIEVAP